MAEIIAIIQARMGSTRLPGKIMFNLEGIPILEHIVNRINRCKLISDLIVATTILKEDIDVVKFCSTKNIRVFCGSEDDVLDRFYQIAKLLKPNNIVRITGDCPMIDPLVITQVIDRHIDTKSDYTSNVIEETFPDGEDVEIFTFAALEKCWKEATLPSEREHVTPYIKKNSNLFKLTNVRSKTNLSDERWTLDHIEDYEYIKRIYYDLYKKNRFFGIDEIISLIQLKPELKKINSHLIRNEGYLKSLIKDTDIDR